MLCVLMAADGKYTARQNVLLQFSHCRSGNRKKITPEKKPIVHNSRGQVRSVTMISDTATAWESIGTGKRTG
jgi:hypothetical protein